MSVACLLMAAGEGRRLGSGLPKALVPLAGEPLLVHASRAVLGCGAVEVLVAVVPHESRDDVARLLAPLTGAPRHLVVVGGGASRQESVQAGLQALDVDPHAEEVDVVLVHDAARCLAPAALVADVVAAVRGGHAAVVPGLPVTDTLKRVDGDGRVHSTVDRTDLRSIQTPQGFARDVLRQAHAAAFGDVVTDDAAMVERLGQPVHVVPGHGRAFKITTAWDLQLAEAVLAR